MPMFSYTSISTSLTSEAYENNDSNMVRKITRNTLIILGIWFSIMYIVIVLGRGIVPKFITNDNRLVEFVSQVLPLAIFIQVFNYGFNVYKCVLQSMGESRWTLLSISIINIVVLSMILIIGTELWHIYLCMGIGYIFICILYKYKFNKVITDVIRKR